MRGKVYNYVDLDKGIATISKPTFQLFDNLLKMKKKIYIIFKQIPEK